LLRFEIALLVKLGFFLIPKIVKLTLDTVLISFAIPYYENEALLTKAIESVLSQTSSNWRLLISLDLEFSDTFKKYLNNLNDIRISVVSNEVQGICQNWNNCLRQVTTEYLTILHSDDELEPDYVATMESLIERYPENVLYFCGAQIIDSDSQPLFSFADSIKGLLAPKGNIIRLNGDRGLSSLLKGCYIMCPTICYRSEVIKKYAFRDKWQMVLDLDLYSRLLFDGHSFIGIRDKAYRYRRHGNNQTLKLTNNFKRFDEEIGLYNEINKLASIFNWWRTVKVSRKKTILKLHLIYLFFESLMHFNFKRSMKILAYIARHF